MPGDDVADAVVEAEVRLQDADALAGPAAAGQVARVTDTLRLPRPAAHHAARRLVTRQELTGVRLVLWDGTTRGGEAQEGGDGEVRPRRVETGR